MHIFSHALTGGRGYGVALFEKGGVGSKFLNSHILTLRSGLKLF